MRKRPTNRISTSFGSKLLLGISLESTKRAGRVLWQRRLSQSFHVTTFSSIMLYI